MQLSHLRWLTLPLLAVAAPSWADQPLSDLFTQGKPILDARYRFENVDQNNDLRDANAQTLRTRAGFQSGQWYGLSGLLEVDNVSRIGDDAYNSTRNGQKEYAVVADPDGTEVNQALLRYDHKLGSAVLGRQRINLDNQRFIGSVAWRQNEQTFDGALTQLKPLDGLTLSYAYLDQVNTVFGPDNGRYDNLTNQANIDGHSHLINAQYVVVPANQCYPLPDPLSLVAGSLAEPLACSIRAVSLSGVKAADRLLILGAGPIGLGAVAAARAQGVEQIIISDVAPKRLEIARQWGARDTVQAREQDVVAYVQEHCPGGVECVIDAVGTTAVRTQAMRAVMPGGRVVLIGLHDEESVFPANAIIRQEINVTGSFAYTGADFAQALDALTRGVIKPGPDWLEERALSEGPSAFAELVDGSARAAKIVLTPPA